MNNLIKNSLKHSGVKIILITFSIMILVVTYLIVDSYYRQLKIHEDKIINKLESIVINVSEQINGDKHQQMFDTFSMKNDITDNYQYENYTIIHDILQKTKAINQIQTSIYTLVLDPKDNSFYFGVSSSDVPFYRHSYESAPDILAKNYTTGGSIRPYHDENGTWISAFHPIKNSYGKVVAILQADEQFDPFIAIVNQEITKNIAISLIFIALLFSILFLSIKSILRKEERLTKILIDSQKLIKQKNKELTDSLYYAKRIQDSILPSKQKILNLFPQSFITFLPRNIVSGDFYWLAEKDDKIIFAAADCTGHGVPGAFMSLIGSVLLNEIVHIKGISTPAEILFELDKALSRSLNHDDHNHPIDDGMDIALCSINKDYSEIQFAGAYNPLIHISDKELKEFKANRFPIGGNQNYNKRKFTNHSIKLKGGDMLYLFTDGYTDQFGGEKGKKFMIKQFKEQLLKINHKGITNQKKDIEEILFKWKKDEEQVDDILVMGIKIPTNTDSIIQ